MSLKLWCIFVLEPFTLSLGLCLFLKKKKKKRNTAGAGQTRCSGQEKIQVGHAIIIEIAE